MKSYYIDEISQTDIDKINAYLKKNTSDSGMEKLYWIEMPEDTLEGLQREHAECRPFRFAVETGDSWLKAEFFIRTSVKFRCDCNGYCSDDQHKFITDYIDALIKKLDIRT